MTSRVVALLRGINVGRNKRVDMSQLRELLAELGYSDVKTLLQSGNAVFTCAHAPVDSAATDIESAIAVKLGVQCKVILRTGAELARAITADPFIEIATDPSRHLVGFLSHDPNLDGQETIERLDVAPDRIRIIGRHLYLWCPDGILVSPISKVNLDRTLGVAVTMRNWNTVTKLAALAGG